MISRRQLLCLGALSGIAVACGRSSKSTTPPTSSGGAAPDAGGAATTPSTTAGLTTVPPTGTSTSAATSTTSTTTTTSTTSSTTPTPTTTAAAAATTLDLATAAMSYTQSGPFPVGVSTLTLAKGNKVEVWYPVVAGTTGQESYDVRDFVPEAIRKILTTDVPATYSFAAKRDADAATGPFPVVLFSHGFTGMRLQSTFLTAHLATWGIIVAAPDHPSRDLSNVLAGTATGSTADSVDDLLKSLELLISEASSTTSRFNARVDATRVVAVGHSAGGVTVAEAAVDPRIGGYVSLASGIRPAGGPASADKPSLFMGGSVDAIVPVETVTRAAFEQAPTPTLLWIIDGVGHNGFDDFCTFGNGTGIIGLADASGLGAVLDAQPQLRALGNDGCLAPAVPVTETFPIIRHAVTAWIRHQFGTDPTPVGLGAEVANAYPVKLTIEQRP